jgi:hypothetical protein
MGSISKPLSTYFIGGDILSFDIGVLKLPLIKALLSVFLTVLYGLSRSLVRYVQYERYILRLALFAYLQLGEIIEATSLQEFDVIVDKVQNLQGLTIWEAGQGQRGYVVVRQV